MIEQATTPETGNRRNLAALLANMLGGRASGFPPVLPAAILQLPFALAGSRKVGQPAAKAARGEPAHRRYEEGARPVHFLEQGREEQDRPRVGSSHPRQPFPVVHVAIVG